MKSVLWVVEVRDLKTQDWSAWPSNHCTRAEARDRQPLAREYFKFTRIVKYVRAA